MRLRSLRGATKAGRQTGARIAVRAQDYQEVSFPSAIFVGSTFGVPRPRFFCFCVQYLVYRQYDTRCMVFGTGTPIDTWPVSDSAMELWRLPALRGPSHFVSHFAPNFFLCCTTRFPLFVNSLSLGCNVHQGAMLAASRPRIQHDICTSLGFSELL